MFRSLIVAFATVALLASNALAAEKIQVASNPTWPPMEFLDGQKNIIGYDADFIKAVAKEAGLEVEMRETAWDGIFAGLAGGNYQLVASAVTITEERKKAYEFTKPYYEVQQVVVSRKGTQYPNFASLKGKLLGGQIGTTGIFVAEKAKSGATIREYDDAGLAMQDLSNGRIDAVICDSPVALYYANKKEGFADKLQVSFRTAGDEFYGFVAQKGNTKLIERLNKGIDAVRAKGIEKELMKKWLE